MSGHDGFNAPYVQGVRRSRKAACLEARPGSKTGVPSGRGFGRTAFPRATDAFTPFGPADVAVPGEPRAESREPRAESREPRAESHGSRRITQFSYCGVKMPMSSKAPRGNSISSLFVSTPATREPHATQKYRSYHGLLSQAPSCPLSATRLRLKTVKTMNGLACDLRQSMQWQMPVRSASPAAAKRTAPHAQPPLMILSSILLETPLPNCGSAPAKLHQNVGSARRFCPQRVESRHCANVEADLGPQSGRAIQISSRPL